MTKLYSLMGQLMYFILLPFIRLAIKSTNRAYVLIINSNNEILMVKNWLSDGKWSLPGGGIHNNETPETAIVREVKEEVGLNLSKSNLIFVSKGKWQTYDLGYTYQIYKILYKDTKQINLRKLEMVDYSWVSNDHLQKIETAQEIKEALKVYK